MWNSYFGYLDYLELRRRVERRLSGSLWLFAHIVVFAFLPLVCFALWPYGWWYPVRGSTLVHDWIAYGMIGWSIVLLLHGLWTYFRSGAWGGRRSQVIETEMRERVRNDDTYLAAHSDGQPLAVETSRQQAARLFSFWRAFARQKIQARNAALCRG
jgi:hypothetical protein